MKMSISLSRQAAQRLFFDRPKVQRAMDRGTRRSLGRFGGFVRLTARRSIRPRKTPTTSPPGSPPYSRTGLLRRGIYYAADLRRQSVVIGPVRLNRGDDAPEVLEHGGVTKRRFVTVSRAGKRRIYYSRKAKPRRVRYPARPYMQPAFRAGEKRLDDFWRNSVRK